MPTNIRRGNAVKSRVSARIEHVFAQQKDRMALFICTIGIKRAETRIALANLADNMQRYLSHERRSQMG